MVKKIAIAQLRKWAKGGDQVAFASKKNAQRYQGVLRRRGFATGTLRSTGPTVDGKVTKSYYVVSDKRRSK